VSYNSNRGTYDDADAFQFELNAALKRAGINDYVRRFHDLRHTSITHDAAAGADPVALMTKAGHSNMKTTQTNLHVAGVVFRKRGRPPGARGSSETRSPSRNVVSAETTRGPSGALSFGQNLLPEFLPT
jgi:Phage integrase family